MSVRRVFIEWIEQGVIPKHKLEESANLLKVEPSSSDWKSFLDRIFLSLGSLSLVVALGFFIAYNWQWMGKFAKFGMVEFAIISGAVAYYVFHQRDLVAKLSLLTSSILVGVLLGLVGQTYQTGADTWELFFYWSLFILPWTIISRFSVLWLFWLFLINISILLVQDTYLGSVLYREEESAVLWMGFWINTAALFLWEFVAFRWNVLNDRWALRCVSTVSGAFITYLVCLWVFSEEFTGWMAFPLWLVWSGILYFFYWKKKPDLYPLAGIHLSTLVFLVCLMGRAMSDILVDGGFLLIAIVMIGLGSASAKWLLRIHKEMQQ